jgi:hypothetical protein
MYLYVVAFLIILSFSMVDCINKKSRFFLMLLSFVGLVLFVGGRGNAGADSSNYLWAWEMTSTIYDDDWSRNPLIAYSEPGYYAFTVILKSINDSSFFYFSAIAAISLALIFKSLQEYSIYPLMGLLVYMSRYFILRDFNQIRAAVAIAIIVYATKYIDKRNTGKFLSFLFVATLFHTSSIIILPFYLLNRFCPTKKIIYIILAGVFVISITFGEFLKTLVDQVFKSMGVLSSYTGEGEYVDGFGILNPLIYFQVFVLILFVAAEDRLKDKQPYYYTIRNGYLFSTVLLMLFSSLLVIGARLSTILATYDIFIIPALISTLNTRSRVVAQFFLYILLTLLYLTNLSRAGDLTYGNFKL